MFLWSALFVCTGNAQTQPKAEYGINGDITGLYGFLHEGEFLQIEVTDGKVTGLVSRFKEEDPESGEFVDQYLEQGTLDGAHLSFKTKTMGGIWFEFSGEVERGSAKSAGDEGYWILRGSIVEHRSAADGKVSDKVHNVALKSFPQDPESETQSGGKKE